MGLCQGFFLINFKGFFFVLTDLWLIVNSLQVECEACSRLSLTIHLLIESSVGCERVAGALKAALEAFWRRNLGI